MREAFNIDEKLCGTRKPLKQSETKVRMRVNSENRRHLWRLIQETGDCLVGKLPDHPNHPKGRNPYAHVASRVKSHFKQSYKDLPDVRLGEVIRYLELIKEEEAGHSG